MRVLPPPLDLSVAGLGSDDLFGRRSLADGLTNLLSISEDPLVVAVDGQWGAGKTTFLAMWADQMKGAGFPVIRFDAFEHDYVDDPFIALAGEVLALADRLAPAADRRRDELARKTLAAGKVIVRHGTGAAIKLVSLGALDVIKASEDVAGAIADAVRDASDEYLQEALSTHAAQQSTLASFRDALSQLPQVLAPPLGGEAQRPLIYIIDELDRCRPIFALQTLERIKHFFAVPNVHFVLGVNLEQLRTSVSAAYGAGVDGGVYLQKFIHLTFQLTTGSRETSARRVAKFVDYLIERLNFPPNRRQQADVAAEEIRRFAADHDLSLRAIERMMTTLALAFALSDPRKGAPAPILGVLCVLKIQYPALFAKAKRGLLRYEELREPFRFPQLVSYKDNPSPKVEAAWWWAICSGGGHDGRVAEFIGGQIGARDTPANELVAHVANDIIDRLQPNQP